MHAGLEALARRPRKNKSANPVILRVENLVRRFGDRTVLDGVNMEVRKGETMVIMGGSGCGKSTLLRHIVGLLRPNAGHVHYQFNGETNDITQMHEEQMDEIRKRIGVLFQNGALFNSITLGENIALPLRRHTRLDPNVIKIMTHLKMDMVGLSGFEHLKPAEISGGMRKRVALARAIAMDPEIIFYDEPSAGLDPIVSSVIDELIMNLQDKMGFTNVVVTHHMDSAFKIADKMIMLYQGKVIASGTPLDVLTSEDERVRQFIFGMPDGPIPLRLSSEDYLTSLLGE